MLTGAVDQFVSRHKPGAKSAISVKNAKKYCCLVFF